MLEFLGLDTVQIVLMIIACVIGLILGIISLINMGKQYGAGFTTVFCLLLGGLFMFFAPVVLPLLGSYFIDSNIKGYYLWEFIDGGNPITDFVNNTLSFTGYRFTDAEAINLLKNLISVVAITYSFGLYFISDIFKKVSKWVVLVLWIIAYQFFLLLILIVSVLLILLAPAILVVGVLSGLFVGIKTAVSNYGRAYKTVRKDGKKPA